MSKNATYRFALIASVVLAVAILVAPTLTVAAPYHGLGMGHGSGSHPFEGVPGGGIGASAAPLKSTSTNWSGYVVQTAFPTGANNTVTDVTATWVVPTVLSGTNDAYAANWIGIDGFSSPTVEQIGTEQDWIGGAPFYAAWWEMFPGGSVTIPSVGVHAGDVMTAQVHWISGNQFQLTLNNTTTGQSFSTAQTMGSTVERSCAEWIVEAPSSSTGVLPFTHQSSSSFTSCTVTLSGVTGSIGGTGWQNQSITLVDGTGTSLAIPTALTGGGTAFVVNAPGVAAGDTIAPSTTSDVVASYSNTATIHLTATDNPGGSGVASTFYQVDGGAVHTGSAITVSTYNMHTLKYWSVDVAGNVEVSHTDSFMINDTIAPTTTPGSTASYVGIASFGLTAADNPGGSGVANTYYSLDGVVYVAGNTVTVTQLGMHTVFFYSVDKAGNSETPRAVIFNITAGLAPSTITIASSASRVAFPKPFNLTGVLTPGSLNDPVVVYVKKPGKAYWSYSSNRLAYTTSGSGALWWYRYTPNLRGAYQFKAQFAGDTSRGPSTSSVIGVTVR
jgi:hypothetical protein